MKRFLTPFLKFLGSSKLALALVLLVTLLAIAGAILPQEGRFTGEEMSGWQDARPSVTKLLRPLGLFHVFHSLPFLALLALLAINTLTCTMLYLGKEGGIAAFKGPGAVRKTGFLLLHLSLIGIMAGGFISAGMRMDGYLVLTEGQAFTEEHKNYSQIYEAPLYSENHRGFTLELEDVQVILQKQWFPVDISAKIEIKETNGESLEKKLKINYPTSVNGLDITLDKVGFSPRLVITDRGSRERLLDSFMALRTFEKENKKEYKDFLPLPVFENRLVVTLYPNHTIEDGRLIKTGDAPDNPVLLVQFEDNNGNVVSSGILPFKSSLRLENYVFVFAQLRRWASFRVMDDPGYPVIWFSLWLAVIALVMRYAAELKGWFRSDLVDHEGHEEHEEEKKGG